MDQPKYNSTCIREAFNFLVDDFGYEITEDNELFHDDRPYAYILEFKGNDRIVHLNYDYKEQFFYFKIIRGLNTDFPNDMDLDNILPFLKVFKTANPGIDLKIFQPSESSCVEAAKLNAEYLKEYGSEILLGENWI